MSRRTGLSIRRISGHCTVTGDGVMAWYRLAPQSWSFRPDSAREQLIVEGADVLAHLTKRQLHLRVTTRPYPVSRWAQAHDENAPNPLPGWAEHLRADQMHLARRSMADKEVYLGVSIPDARRALRIAGGFMPSMSDREVLALHKPVRETDEILALPGLEAAPATPREVEWLLHRSCSLGLPAPVSLGCPEDGEWAEEDLYADQVQWSATPYGRTIQIRGERDGEMVERHVCVMSVGRMTDLDIPPGVPWMQRTDELPFPVEWSGRAAGVRAGKEVTLAATHASAYVASLRPRRSASAAAAANVRSFGGDHCRRKIRRRSSLSHAWASPLV